MVSLLCFAGLTSVSVYAADGDDEKPATGFLKGFGTVNKIASDSGVQKDQNLSQVILRITGMIVALVSVVALAMVIIGGFLYLISGGQEDKVKKAKNLILAAIIGIVIVGVAGLVVNFVVNIFVAAPKG